MSYGLILFFSELPHTIRVDRGTETDPMTSIHCRLHQLCGTYDDLDQIINDCVFFGPSTANKIERWWRELHHRMESFFKEQLSSLLEFGHYDQTSQLDRYYFYYFLQALFKHY